MTLLESLRKNPFVLAPMAGVTDSPFRALMREMQAGIVVTELVSANGLKFNSQKTRDLLSFTPDQKPIGAQIFGEDAEALGDATRLIEDLGFDFVDLNFGCPVPKVVKKGAGAAVLRDLARVQKIFRTMKSSTQLPVTVKIRTGWTYEERNAAQVAQVAYDEGLTWVAIHGRTRAQGYSGSADWDYITSVKSQAPLPIIGNGDLTSPHLAVKALEKSQCDGVMIGRGCLKNPYIFAQCLQIMGKSAETRFKPLDQVVVRFYDLLEAQYHSHPRMILIQMRKFIGWFSHGYPGSSALRREIFKIQDAQSLLRLAKAFFAELAWNQQEDTSHEAFMMGGHG